MNKISNNKTQLSKFLALLLRHKPHTIGLTLDKNGWARVEELICLINKQGQHTINFEILCEIVENDDKQRFAFNDDKSLVRTSQGHSIAVDVELKECCPPDILYHGTATKYEENIDKDGLISKNRLYVHLSADMDTAKKVGARHGQVLIYEVDCNKMKKEGFKFFISENNVWLTKNVPVRFLRKMLKLR